MTTKNLKGVGITEQMGKIDPKLVLPPESTTILLLLQEYREFVCANAYLW